MKNIFKKYSIQLKLLMVLSIGLLFITIIYYFAIPKLLNYPAGTYGTQFQVELEHTYYFKQVLMTSCTIFIIFILLTFWKTQFLIKYNDLIRNPSKYSIKEINYVKNKLLTVPYQLFGLSIVIPSVSLTIINAFMLHTINITTFKLFILVICLTTLYVTVFFIYTSNLFKQILLKLPYDDIVGLKKDSLYNRFFYNISPLIIISILFTSLIGYTIASKKNGDSLFETYSNSLKYFASYNEFNSLSDLSNKAKQLTLYGQNDYVYIRKSDNNYVDLTGKRINMSNFFNKYLNELSESNNGRVYEYYGIDCQSATATVNVNGQNYIIGIYFYIISTDVLLYFSISFFILLIMNIIILSLFARLISSEINTISSRFSTMAKKANKNYVFKPLSLTSNDEIGKLIISYNQIQKLTQENIQQIHDNQESLMEKERLASLGQLIGGIAHNLKTPIMSIAGAMEGLQDLINEYDHSIDDQEVTSEDHHAIAKEMGIWVEKVSSYDSYMSDIITAVKGQAVNFTDISSDTFTIDELLSRVNILMKHELKNAFITLNVNCKINPNIKLKGNVNSLVQVVNNLISNAIQAYDLSDNNNKKIDLTIFEKDNNILLTVKDYGCGIPEEVQKKLFNQMITTKGRNGTGLGLFMSYSTIKGNFNGDLSFTSKVGEGTTFTIVLPQ